MDEKIIEKQLRELGTMVTCLMRDVATLKDQTYKYNEWVNSHLTGIVYANTTLVDRIKRLEELAMTESLPDEERSAAYAKCLREIIFSVIGFAKLKEDCHNEIVKGVERMLKGEGI